MWYRLIKRLCGSPVISTRVEFDRNNANPINPLVHLLYMVQENENIKYLMTCHLVCVLDACPSFKPLRVTLGLLIFLHANITIISIEL